MKPSPPVLAGLFVLILSAATAASIDVIIVAGQSNALNWHAAAADLPASERDGEILFYHESGGPPSRGKSAINATSSGRWLTLRVQRQEPFVKFEHDFFGPEMTLARRISETGPRFAVIKVAYFGTNLALDWNPAATAGNQLYLRLREQVSVALQSLRERGDMPRIVGFFWMQGETDASNHAHAAAYAGNLSAFIARIRADLDNPSLRFVLGRIGPQPARGYPHQNEVRAAQVNVAANTPNVAWVDTDDLLRDVDGIHLLGPGVMALGERMERAWRALGQQTPER